MNSKTNQELLDIEKSTSDNGKYENCVREIVKRFEAQLKTIDGLKQEKAGIQNQLDFFIGGIAYKRIEELEKGNRELYAKLAANRSIFKTTVRNEYLYKIEDLELQRDGQSITIDQQTKTIKELQATVNRMDIACEKDEKYIGNLLNERDNLVNKLTNQPKLNRQEVEEVFDNYLLQEYNNNEEKIITMEDETNIITAICELAISPKEIDKEKIVTVLVREFNKHICGDGYDMTIFVLNLEEEIETIATEIINSLNGKEGK